MHLAWKRWEMVQIVGRPADSYASSGCYMTSVSNREAGM